MGARYQVMVVTGQDLNAARPVLADLGLTVSTEPQPLTSFDGVQVGAVGQVGGHIVFHEAPMDGPGGGVGERAIARALAAQVCTISEMSVVDYQHWSVSDATGRNLRYWSYHDAGDEPEVEEYGEPLPEEEGMDPLRVDDLLQARTGIVVYRLAQEPHWFGVTRA